MLPWVLCLALGAAAHVVWALDAWWRPGPSTLPPIVVHVATPPAPPQPSPPAIVVHDRWVGAPRVEPPAAFDAELVRMLVDRHVRCDAHGACTIDPRLVRYLLATPHTTGRRPPGRLGERPRAFATSVSP